MITRIRLAFILATLITFAGTFSQAPVRAMITPTVAVGATPGSLTVGDSGAATYTVPIVVAPGTNGVQPSLALVYNSQGGNSLLGLGWSMSGLSVVHRCAATIELDGFRGGVNYDANDRFCLDGERLVSINSAEHRTDRESLQRVFFSGSAADPASVTVRDKDGSTRQYGATSDSRIEAQGKAVARLWALSKITDRHGNTLDIVYGEDNASGDYRPVVINYGANAAAGTAHHSSVIFAYETRDDVVFGFEAGSLAQVTQRLRRITSWTGGVKVRDYWLTYDQSATSKRSRLISLQECGTDDVCLPATRFTWHEGAPSRFSVSAESAVAKGDAFALFPMDVDGDGKADIVEVSNTLDIGESRISNGDGTFRLSAQSAIGDATGFTLVPADVNGDAKADIVEIENQATRGWSRIGRGDGTFSVSAQSTFGKASLYQAIPGDIDGDGRTDIVQVSTTSDIGRPYLSNGDGTFRPAVASVVGDATGFTLLAADVNGDGKMDIVEVETQATRGRSRISLGDGTFVASALTTFGKASLYRNLAADVNGDGKTDIVQVSTTQDVGRAYLSKGDGTFMPSVASVIGDATGFFHLAADVDGDSKADIVEVSTSSNRGWVRISNGDGTFRVSEESSIGRPEAFVLLPADVNGDGKTDIVEVLKNAHRGWSVLSLGGPPELISTIRTGLGVATTISYAPLTDSTVYTKDNNSVYPYADVQDATHVVSSLSSSDGIGGTVATSYKYGGLKYHHTAGASLGFRWLQITDPTGIRRVSYNNQDRAAGLDDTLTSSSTYFGDVRIKHVVNTWAVANNVCGGTSQAQPKTVVEETRDLNGALISTTSSDNTYDSCGYATRVSVSTDDGWRKTSNNTYNHDTANWRLGQITYAEVTAEAPGGVPPQTRTSAFTFDDLGLIDSETIEPNNSTLALTTTYRYDIFGNRTSKSIGGQGISTRTETQSYEPQGRFVAMQTNTLGHEARFEFDARNGQPTRATDANGLMTAWDYDGMGRKGFELRPDGTKTTIRYESRTTGYAISTMASGSANTFTDYDILGREIRRATFGFGGRWTFATTKYDTLGRVVRTSNPYFDGDPVYETVRTYDALGRVTASTAPGTGNRTLTTRYDGLSVTVTNALGQQTVSTKNSQGMQVVVRDAGGNSTFYAYDAFGNLLAVTDPAGNVTSMTYDLRGRKIAMRDPDMGAWSYEYNVLGELIGQTDAKGQRITMAHDKLGRLLSRTTPEGQSTLLYDVAAKGIGKLASVTGTNGYRESYTYDVVSRPTSTTLTIAGTAYTTSRIYDDFGRLGTVTYPGAGYTIRHTYDDFGYLWRIGRLIGGAEYLVWMANEADAFNHVTSELFGNTSDQPTASARVYDQATSDLLRIQTGPSSGATSLTPTTQHLSYTYDVLHNLTGRSDAVTGLSETFAYDELNRLTRATGAITKTYQYDSIGNITYKSDVGTYSYLSSGQNSIRPHAVASVAGTVNASYSYDANGNMQSGAGRTMTYTSFNKPESISTASAVSTFLYDANYSRVQKITNTKTITYVGKLFEREASNGVVQDKSYIYAGNNLVAIHTDRSTGSSDTKYVHADHLGSINVITGDNGAVIERTSFDPHGKRRNPNGQELTTTPSSQVNRGFTNHEMDDEVGLINMNARLYDPVLGRFITPDPLVEGIAGQDLNRYTYVRNNPLSLTDPTGNFSLKKAFGKIFRVAVAVVATYYTAGAVSGFLTGSALSAGSSAFAAVKAGATTASLTGLGHAVTGAASGAVGGFAFTGNAKGALSGALAGGIAGVFASSGILGQSLGGGINGYLQTGTPEGFLRGFGSGLIPQDLWLESAYRNNPLANIGIGIARDAARGYVVNGRDGIAVGIGLGQTNNAVGHLVGLATTFSVPDFKNGAFTYEGSWWIKQGAITFGNVISGPPGLSDSPTSWLYRHERGHVPQGNLLGAAYIPAHVTSLSVAAVTTFDHHSKANLLENYLNQEPDVGSPSRRQPDPTFRPAPWLKTLYGER
jgi:RHS repeat-associated protein